MRCVWHEKRWALGRSAPAFSLLELLIVMVIIGVAAAIAVPRFAAAGDRYTSEVAARRLAMDLRFAQQSARSTSSSWRVVVASDGKGWVVEAVPAEDGGSIDSGASASVSGSAMVKEGVSVEEMKVATAEELRRSWELERGVLRTNGSVAVSLGARTLVFDGYGLPSRGVSFEIGDGVHRREVCVTASGLVEEK